MPIDDRYLHSDITHAILQAFYTVCRRLPWGLPSDFYKNALTIELTKSGFHVEADKNVAINYDQQLIGSLPIDLVVNNSVVISIVSADDIITLHVDALKTLLRLSEYEVGLILNFAIEGQHKRVVYTNDLKKN